jgi:hypothetical protein
VILPSKMAASELSSLGLDGGESLPHSGLCFLICKMIGLDKLMVLVLSSFQILRNNLGGGHVLEGVLRQR